MSLFTGIKNVFSSAPGLIRNITPGSPLAKGLGVSLATIGLNKEQKRLDEQQRELEAELMKRMNEARTEGNEQKMNRLKTIAEQTLNHDAPNLFEAVVKKAPSNKQVVASAAELGLTAAIGFRAPLKGFGLMSRGAVKAVSSAKRLQKLEALKEVGKIQRFARVQGLNIARESLIGSAFMASIKAQDDDATAEDVVRAAELGAFIGGGTVVAAGLLGKGLKVAGPRIQRLARRATQKAEEVVGRGRERVGATEIDRTLKTLGQKRTPKEVTAEVYLKGVQASRQFKARFVDRLTSLKRIEDTLLDIKGAPLSETEKVYRDARVLRSRADAQAEELVTKLGQDLRPFDDVKDELRAYLAQLDYIDRAKLGQKTPKGDDVRTLTNQLKKLVDEIGPEKMERVGQARQIVRDYQRGQLQIRLDAGLISKTEMDRLLKAHPNYIPHNVIMKNEERAARAIGGSLNVEKTDLRKAIGSLRNIQDPLTATVQRTPITTLTVQKNTLLKNLVEVQENTGVISGMRKVKTTFKPNKETEGIINLFRDGKKEKWVVPKDVEVAIKNLDAPLRGKFHTIITLPAKSIRNFATRFNLSFAIPNKFRDKQTAALTAKAFIDDAAKRYGVAPQKIPTSKKAIQELYKREGGYGSSIFKDGDDKIFEKLSNAGIGEKVKTNIRPDKLVERINDSFEQSTRLDVFKRAMQAGLNPRDAALVARDATIDFAKMGSWMKPVNEAIPFLNARVQGFVNLPKAFVNSPEVFARMQLYTGVYPTILLQKHNSRYESYKNIGDYYKNKYWIIMTGETEVRDKYTGNPVMVPQFITVPKGEGQALVSGPIQAYLDKAIGADFRKWSEVTADTIGSASPLEFQTFNSRNFFETLLSQVGPLATVPYGLGSNINAFFGTPIVPEQRLDAPEELQFKPSTPEATREIADIIGVAPARLEFVLNSLGGGVSQDVQEGMDLIFGLLKREDLAEDLREESLSETSFGIGTRIPLARRFLREASEFYSPESEFRKRQIKEIRTELTGKRLRTKDRAEEIFRELNRRENREDKLNYLNSLGDELDLEMRKAIFNLKTRQQTVETLKKSDPIELRARYINLRLEEMRANGISREDRVEYLNLLEANGILTERVKKMIAIIQNQ